MIEVAAIRDKYKPLSKMMNEKMRRLWAAGEAKAIGWGGVCLVSEATGLSRTTITTAMKEVENMRNRRTSSDMTDRIRRPGGGRKMLTKQNPHLLKNLEELLESSTRGDPQSPLKWTCKSTSRLQEELRAHGHQVGVRKVAYLLHDLKYSLQSNRKTLEGASHPDRNAQFEHINNQTRNFQAREQPVISVDTKKKELIGSYRNVGREWHAKGKPKKVLVHDFPDKELGKGIPYGVYDLTANHGWVSVGIDHDTAEFAGETIRRWWFQMGQREYLKATEILIMADGGGSNGSRSRLWKIVLQRLANEVGLKIFLCHFPPGTSKWNKIEHRMFSHITQNWRGRPLTSHEVMVNLIGNTTTKKGLKIKAELDKKQYQVGIKVSNKELAAINIQKDSFHGEWNYQISPQTI